VVVWVFRRVGLGGVEMDEFKLFKTMLALELAGCDLVALERVLVFLPPGVYSENRLLLSEVLYSLGSRHW
jgi:hypothetical protein